MQLVFEVASLGVELNIFSSEITMHKLLESDAISLGICVIKFHRSFTISMS